MLIDNVNIKEIDAVLMEKNIQPSSIELDGEYAWLKNSLLPFFPKQDFKFISIEVKLYIKGKDESDVKSKIGTLINKSKDCILKFDDDFYYQSFLINCNTENTLKKESKKISLSFIAYSYKEEVTETMNRITNKTINVAGNLETPAILEIIPSIDLIDLTLTGLAEDPIILKNLKANKKLIVNGEDSTVTVDGVNKFSDTDMWGFPKLSPGANTITTDKSSVDITIKYKPRYI
ncbi:phage distal tail protein [Clostridium nigeriense]|uniref:phage distal tail protein n=1 Tax=Clostridium nigeriense TaxID=1805470 RepID=UPI003D32ED85